jgi:geranylgeranyl pyrophosphate synthase
VSATLDSAARALEILAQERAPVENALVHVLDRYLQAVDTRLADPIRYAVLGGGKRLRPILCATAYHALADGTTPEAVYEAASSIEIIHTYSLVHDDLPCMDNDDLRRGRPTTHRVYGDVRAALAGVAMIPLACRVLEHASATLGLLPAERSELLLELVRGAGVSGMIGGQALDLEAEGHTVDAAGLEAIHLRKTGALFAASLRIGGRLASAPTAVLDALGRSGRALGLAFQVTDDLLDVTGQPSVLGKTAGRDEQHRKATYPAVVGMGGARDQAARAGSEAVRQLREGRIRSDALEALIEFAVQRDR